MYCMYVHIYAFYICMEVRMCIHVDISVYTLANIHTKKNIPQQLNRFYNCIF
jgi:hypothetical protein